VLNKLKKKDLNGTIKKGILLLHSEKDGGKVSHISFLTGNTTTVLEVNKYTGEYSVIGYSQSEARNQKEYIEDLLKIDWLLENNNVIKINFDFLEKINEIKGITLEIDNVDYDS